MNRTVVGIIILAIFLGGGIFLYRATQKSSTQPSNQSAPATTSTQSTPVSDVPTTSASQAAGQIKEFTVTGSNFKLTPANIMVKKGERVRIVFKNSEGFHGLEIDGLNVSTANIPSGQSAVAEFTADKTGTFAMYCPVGNHRAQGMEGTVTVQ